MLDKISVRQGMPVRFKQCKTCKINYEYIIEFWEYDSDDECTYCINNEETPFYELEFVTREDYVLQDLPTDIDECFANIDPPIEEKPVPVVVEEVTPPKKKKKKKK